ncbi:transposase family protein [Planomonospora parontospora]|uniref:transposase family protein n=1 Tax=Planomonospora parontospora TaxID=58119 RepID=UPI0019ACA6CE|nr:hypothetical protein GCM10014719_49460 [Planomonospora parontospora subsp. antibiotica]GII18415.1 hypothetical protein Ppa05_51410 [Planomonospora parontospora subsp. antibiotica]
MPASTSSPITPVLGQLAALTCPTTDPEPIDYAGLLEHLARIPDPRDPRGVRHTLGSLLAVTTAAILTGARSFTAIGEWIADAPATVLAALGVRQDRLTAHPPHRPMIDRAPGSGGGRQKPARRPHRRR